MHDSQNGTSLYELFIVLTLALIIASVSYKSFIPLFDQEKTLALHRALKNALLLAKKEAASSHADIAFCIGHNQQCFKKPITESIIYADTFHDGTLRNNMQIKRIVPLPQAKGELFFRSFPHYRRALRFQGTDWLTSDNGTFWFCTHPHGKPIWALSINRVAMMRDLTPNQVGEVLDSSGKPLLC